MDLLKYGKLAYKLTPALNKQIIDERLELNKLIEEYNNRNVVPKPKVKQAKDNYGYTSSEEEEVSDTKTSPKLLTTF